MNAKGRFVSLGSALVLAALAGTGLCRRAMEPVTPAAPSGPLPPALAEAAPLEPALEPVRAAAGPTTEAMTPSARDGRVPDPRGSRSREGSGLLVAGRVLDVDGRPVEARVQVLRASARKRLPVRVRSTSRPGSFEAHGRLDEGRYQVIARFGTGIAERLDVAEGTLDLELRLHPAPGLRGTVVDDRGEPVPAFEVRIARLGPVAPLTLALAGVDGAFAFEGLLAGDWSVHVSGQGIHQEEPCLVTVPSPEPVVVRVASWPVVEGTVVERRGFPVPEARIWRRLHPELAEADENGVFRLTVPIGTTTLSASHAWLGSSPPMVLDLAPGEVVTGVTLVLEPPAVLRGRVLDMSGQPEPGASIRVTRLGGDQVRSTRSDDEGRFVLDALFAGEASIDALCRGFDLSCAVSLAPGETTDVTLAPEVGPPVPLRGRVRFGGTPVAEGFFQASRRLEGVRGDLRLPSVRIRDGTYEAELPGAGRYDLWVHGEAWDLTRSLEVSEGDAVLDLELERSVIDGWILDASGVGLPELEVRSACAEGIDGTFQASRWTDSLGRFRLEVVPGRHDLYVDGGHLPRRTVVVPPGETLTDVEVVLE